MAAIAVEFTEFDRIKLDEWSESIVSGAKVIRGFTTYSNDTGNKYQFIPAGSISTSYSGCYFSFISDSGVECLVNVSDVYSNEDYFVKIEKEVR